MSRSVSRALGAGLGCAVPLAVLAQGAPPVKPAAPGASASAVPTASASAPPLMKVAAPPASALAPEPPGKGKKKGKKELPDLLGVTPSVRLVVVAPSADGAWTVRVDNEGDRAVRIPADVRLLSFDVERYVATAAKKKDGAPTYKTEKATCRLPDSMRPGDFPEPRALVLRPGEMWIERFDPRLFCFGKQEAFVTPGAVVRARLGFAKKAPPFDGLPTLKPDPPKKAAPPPGKPKKLGKAPKPPYAAESLDAPWAFDPQVELVSATVLLSHDAPPPEEATPVRLEGIEVQKSLLKVATSRSQPLTASWYVPPRDEERPKVHVGHGTIFSNADQRPARVVHTSSKAKPPQEAKPEAKEPEGPEPVHDANSPRFVLKGPASVGAGAPRNLRLSVSVELERGRETHALLRDRDLSFVVVGPEKTVTCGEVDGDITPSREKFRKFGKGDKASFDVLLIERCPTEAFSRPGLYRVTPVLKASASGSSFGLKAFVGELRADRPTLVRIETAREPFYAAAPVARKMPAPVVFSDDAPAKEPAKDEPKPGDNKPPATPPPAPSAPAPAPAKDEKKP